jgi:hypothetical protein
MPHIKELGRRGAALEMVCGMDDRPMKYAHLSQAAPGRNGLGLRDQTFQLLRREHKRSCAPSISTVPLDLMILKRKAKWSPTTGSFHVRPSIQILALGIEKLGARFPSECGRRGDQGTASPAMGSQRIGFRLSATGTCQSESRLNASKPSPSESSACINISLCIISRQ